MQITRILKTTCLCAALLSAASASSQAQTSATWVGPVSGGEWNTGTNWDVGVAPADATTNATIGGTINANYNLPMIAASFGGLTNRGVLNINTNGFNAAAVVNLTATGKVFVNSKGVVNLSGNFGLCSNSVVSLAAGSSVTVGGSLLIGSNPTGGSGSATVGAFGSLTNNGGALTATTTSLNPNNQSIGTPCLLVIKGGTNNLGNVTINRSPGGASAPPTLGTDGLVISNGLVNVTSMSIGNNAHSLMFLVGGTVTNTGAFTLKMVGTTQRPARFRQTGGLYVSTDSNVIAMSPSGAAAAETSYTVLGGTNIVGGFQFGDLVPNIGLVNFTNAATIYVGSAGINANGSVTLNAALNNGGLFGATADWINSAPLALTSGTFTFQTADADGTPHNINSTGVLRGPGSLNKTGSGILILGAANTYLGSTLINNGALTLDVNGSLASSPVIVGSGTIFDVSAVSGGYTLSSTKTLSGSGVVTGAVAVASAGIINPGSNALSGTLTFASSVTETGGAINHFDLSGDPNGPNNDFINIAGDLNVSGTNTLEISGTLPSGVAYGLIHYGGSFNGSLANFAVSGTTGTLSNNVTSQTIYLVIATSLRAPTNVTWLGNAVANTWDAQDVTNWLNGVALDFFLGGDNARFDNTGGINPLVNIVGSVSPASITVDSTSNYTFTGSGLIGGTGGLTKTNSGILTVLTTNLYTGITTIGGGVLEVTSVADGGTASPFGAATPDPLNLVFTGGTLRYSGDGAGMDRGATFSAGSGGTIDVTNSATTLTLSGTMTGGGTLNKSGAGTLILSGVNAQGSTVVSNGLLQISTTASAIGSGTLRFAGGSVRTSVSGQPIYPNALDIAANGLFIAAGGNNTVVSGPWSGSATLSVNMSSGGTFTVNGTMTTNFTGTVLLTDDSTGTFRFNAGGNGSGAQQFSGSPLVTFDLGNSSVTLLNRNGGGVSFGTYFLGALAGGPSTVLRGSANAGSGSIYQIGDKNLDTTFAGSIQNGAGGTTATTAITKVGTGTFTLSGASTYTGSTAVNNGVLALGNTGNGDGSINNSTNINIMSGAFLDVSGLSTSTLSLQSSQTLRGNGTLLGSLDTTAGGTVAPGASIGTLTVTNAITLGGNALMEINRASSPNSDRLVSSLSTITYGGTLTVTNIGASLQPGDTFTLFSGGGLGAGVFSSIVLPGYYTWNTSNLGVDGSVSVTGVLAGPTIGNIDASTISSGTLTLNASNGAPNGNYTLLSSTNVALPVINWTHVVSGTFDGSGNLTGLAITVDPAAPQQYFMLQAF